MAQNWKAIAKHTGITVVEVGVIGFSTVLTAKFLDARILFKDAMAKDPTMASKWYIKHQGAIKLAGGALAASFIKNPWLKMVFIGVALNGFIEEAVTVTTNSDGVPFFNKIGAAESSIDEEMLAAADSVNGYGDRYASAVSGYGDRYASAVSGGSGNIDLNDMQANYVSGFR